MKEFAQVKIRTVEGDTVLHNNLGVEQEIAIMARSRNPRIQSMAQPLLSIILERDTITFGVSDGDHAEKPFVIDVDEIPVWHKYVLANLDAMDTSVPKINAVLHSSFLNAATQTMTPAMSDLGREIGERLNYGAGILIGEGPHSQGSQRVLLKVAHGLIGFCPSVHQRHEDSLRMSQAEGSTADAAFGLRI